MSTTEDGNWKLFFNLIISNAFIDDEAVVVRCRTISRSKHVAIRGGNRGKPKASIAYVSFSSSIFHLSLEELLP